MQSPFWQPSRSNGPKRTLLVSLPTRAIGSLKSIIKTDPTPIPTQTRRSVVRLWGCLLVRIKFPNRHPAKTESASAATVNSLAG